jgi:alanine racemase
VTRRWAWAEIDHDAIAGNARALAARAAARDAVAWWTVKADGYGHGATEVARTALAAGGVGLCVALASEALALREAGVRAPILVLSPQPAEWWADLARADAHVVLDDEAAIVGYAAAAAATGRTGLVHLKVDTGMHRVGAAPADAARLARLVATTPTLSLEGIATHYATADLPGHPALAAQSAALARAVDEAAAAGATPRWIHAANSAALLRAADDPAAGAAVAPRRGREGVLARVGIALYGLSAGPGVPAAAAGLRPALALRARVSHVTRVRAGEGVSYGHRWVAARDATIATLPLGYADGIPRRAWDAGLGAVVGGARRPFAGVVTMDQCMVDCGDHEVRPGDEAVLIGAPRDAAGPAVTAEEWAERLGTITYEVTCAISARVPRVHLP